MPESEIKTGMLARVKLTKELVSVRGEILPLDHRDFNPPGRLFQVLRARPADASWTYHQESFFDFELEGGAE